jgi:hypothetical protein
VVEDKIDMPTKVVQRAAPDAGTDNKPDRRNVSRAAASLCLDEIEIQAEEDMQAGLVHVSEIS